MSKKTIQNILISILVLGIISLVVVNFTLKQKKGAPQEAEKASNLDEYVNQSSELLSTEETQSLLMERKEVSIPVPVKIPSVKITMVPQMLGGGDPVYQPVGEANQNFFILDSSNWNKVFKINTPQEAEKYIDFLMVTLGSKKYDRIKKTVWKEADYKQIGCRASEYEKEYPLPKARPVTKAKATNEGFEVTWVYFSAAYPAGYFKEVYLVKKNGEVETKKKQEKPFHSCGTGILF